MNIRPHDSLLTDIRPHPGHPCAETGSSTEDTVPVLGVWSNLHDLAQTWNATTTTLFSRLPAPPHVIWLFQGIGQGYLALSQEDSAYAHYQLVANRLRYPPSVVAEGLEQTLTDLHEAYILWVAVGYWFERLANEVSRVPDLLEPLRTAIHLVRTQQQRLWALLLTVGEEHTQAVQQAERWTQEQGWHRQEETTA
jgi:hypothetical protein